MEDLNKIESILDLSGEKVQDEELPKIKIQIEKKDRGLYSRTEESVILLTEDNKILLND